MITTIQKWGNSQGIRIPMTLLKQVSFREDEPVSLIVSNGTLVVKKATILPTSIEEMFKGYEGDYQCEEVVWGDDLGREQVW